MFLPFFLTYVLLLGQNYSIRTSAWNFNKYHCNYKISPTRIQHQEYLDDPNNHRKHSFSESKVNQYYSNQRSSRLFSSPNNNDGEDDIETFEALKALSEQKSSVSTKSSISGTDQKKLGINIGAMLDPLSERDANELKAAATEMINDAYAEGVDEISKLRTQMNLELEQQRKIAEQRSQQRTQVATEQLLNKIDSITNEFLQKTEPVRTQTKLAALADEQTAQSRSGYEYGVWGIVDGVTIGTDATFGRSSVLGSVEAAKKQRTETNESKDSTKAQSKSIIIIADENSDPIAKQLVGPLQQQFQSIFPGIDIAIYKPTATVPLGGGDAQCVIVFLTSLSDVSSINNLFDRIIRTTMQGSSVVPPPTQYVAISTIGTERYDKMPYSMQNLMSGGKIAKRRQMEESFILNLDNRGLTATTPFDYTIVKFGEIKGTSKDIFQLSPFDTIDGTTDTATATTVLVQAIAYQPPARNSTLNVIGSLPSSTADEKHQQQELDDIFLKLEGPEVVRFTIPITSRAATKDISMFYTSFVEYVREWGTLLAETGKGLTTPVRARIVRNLPSPPPQRYIQEQAALQLIFLPTQTGQRYLNKDEEQERRNDPSSAAVSSKKTIQDGGLEFVTERLATTNEIRVRVKRCNYSKDAVIKEISEETILSRFKQSIDVWNKIHPN